MKKDSDPRCYMPGCNAYGYAVVNTKGEFIERLCGLHVRLKYFKIQPAQQIK